MNTPRPRTFIAHVEDRPGVLNRVISLFRRRAYNIDSLTVARTERPNISRITLVVVAVVGQKLVRNIYKGVESLTALAHQMRRHDYQAVPRYTPSGELGDVLDAFLGMRGDVRKFEGELNQQLARNEQVRAALQEREVFQRSLFAAARVAIMSLDLDGRFTGRPLTNTCSATVANSKGSPLHTTTLASRPGCSDPIRSATPKRSATVKVTARSAASQVSP